MQEFIDEGFLTLTVAPRPAGQKTIYRDCMDNAYDKYNWLAFIDLDEYINMRQCAPLQHVVLEVFNDILSAGCAGSPSA